MGSGQQMRWSLEFRWDVENWWDDVISVSSPLISHQPPTTNHHFISHLQCHICLTINLSPSHNQPSLNINKHNLSSPIIYHPTINNHLISVSPISGVNIKISTTNHLINHHLFQPSLPPTNLHFKSSFWWVWK